MAAISGAVAGDELRSIDPATLEVVGAVPVTSAEGVVEAVQGAADAQGRWAASRPDERGSTLRALAELVVAYADAIAATVTAESGKPIVESFTSELFPAVENATWLSSNASRILRGERLPMPQLLLKHKRGRLVYEPLGVIGVVSPWNFPFSIPFTQAASAVAAGNGAVVKPAEWTPLSGAWVERLFAEAGFPAGLVRVVQGEGPAAGAELVRAPGVAKLIFTGSAATGREVATMAGELLRPVTLELGGKDPMLVFADCDFERAVAGALWAAFTNCGQVCSGVERVYVQQPLLERFVSELAVRAGGLRIGPGGDSTTDLGPLIRERQRARVEELVADAFEHGAEAACGAGRPHVSLPGWFYEPTVLAGVRIGGRIADEEVFGPVVTVEPFADEDEAVRLANGSRFGLGASVWTRDSARARRIAGRLRAGSVWTNDAAYSYYAAQATWGGCKESGFGRTHGKHGLYGLSHVKFVDADSGRVRVPWWYPYGPSALEGFRGSLGVLYAQGVRRRWGLGWGARQGLAHMAKRYLGRT
jgi:acyl-CoA reductase-like NAD-dependent aldehyde dehydrogenase